MSKYSAMTDDELRRAIAERLGYTYIKTIEDKLWALHPDGFSTVTIPIWPQLVDVALTLPIPENSSWELSAKPKRSKTVNAAMSAVIVEDNWGGATLSEGMHDASLARAMCEAWLAMMEREAKGTETR
jgi:hypothetical protein